MQLGGGSNNVGSTEINDDSIVNDDINSAAAIAGSKLQALSVGANAGVIPSTGITNSHLSTSPAIAASKMAESVIRTDEITISSADILALHTTPKTLVAAPGAGKAIIVDEIIVKTTPGTQYANGDQWTFRYNGDTTNIIVGPTAAQINAATAKIISQYPVVANSEIVATNVAFELKLLSATAFITGNGTAKAFIKYRIITL